MRIKLLWLLGVAAALTAALLLTQAEEGERPRETEAASRPPYAPPPVVLAPALPISAAAAASLDIPAKILTRADNPYAEITRLRQQKIPGSYAKAAMLVDLCKEAIGSIYRYRFYTSEQLELDGSPKSSRDGEIEARRAASMQSTEARCRDVFEDKELQHPLSDDTYGQAFENAKKQMTNATRFQDRRLALQQLNQQGQLASAYRDIAGMDGGPIFFNGKIFKDQEANEFQSAASLYFLMGSDFSDSGNQDLRYLIICNTTVQCPNAPIDEILKDKSAAERARIATLAAAIRDALEAGNIEAFLPQDTSRP
ncbi:hypothetical protein SAMN05216359_1115 [Roseateles sp. YR242]|uniref:hypothetical protein n=1 Tax=Roseateles sp. YR242 TaxID=1855305 RepID=UPI0008CD2C31|nr:hypothetical protein [Roseateles sp. YR242]SEL55277.1 hypothetical protein SAMN05216359_1115 [Roseateles sp. YR242]